MLVIENTSVLEPGELVGSERNAQEIPSLIFVLLLRQQKYLLNFMINPIIKIVQTVAERDINRMGVCLGCDIATMVGFLRIVDHDEGTVALEFE